LKCVRRAIHARTAAVAKLSTSLDAQINLDKRVQEKRSELKWNTARERKETRVGGKLSLEIRTRFI
jgi:hypothetical protein